MNLFDLTGKVAIVTGGNSGIGLGMANGLAKAGATVVIAARNLERSTEVVAQLQESGAKALALPCDVTDVESINNMVAETLKQCGSINILVNNAGTNVRKQPEEL